MGVNVRAGRLFLEVWEHGGVTRCVPDNSLVGYCGTHWTQVLRGPFNAMAAAAVESWRANRAAWQECE